VKVILATTLSLSFTLASDTGLVNGGEDFRFPGVISGAHSPFDGRQTGPIRDNLRVPPGVA
jgi:hypothetical protein